MRKKIVRCEGGLTSPPIPVYENDEEFERLLAVARAADAYLLAHEGWMSRGKWDRAMLLGEDLQTALAAVEDLL